MLDRGQVYVMFKKYDNRELFQILTPLAALKLGHNSVAIVRTLPDKTTEVQFEEGEGRLMFGPAEGQLVDKKIKKHERWLVTAENRAEPSEYFASSDYRLNNNERELDAFATSFCPSRSNVTLWPYGTSRRNSAALTANGFGLTFTAMSGGLSITTFIPAGTGCPMSTAAGHR
jgi:hypothetical protein